LIKSRSRGLNYKVANQYDKFKAKKYSHESEKWTSRARSTSLVSARELSLGYGSPLFDSVNIDLREGEALELRGRNGAGKSTLIKKVVRGVVASPQIFCPSSPGALNNVDSVGGGRQKLEDRRRCYQDFLTANYR
jgi:ATPase subunit of ABC transporter with duplicated ATPase domains